MCQDCPSSVDRNHLGDEWTSRTPASGARTDQRPDASRFQGTRLTTTSASQVLYHRGIPFPSVVSWEF